MIVNRILKRAQWRLHRMQTHLRTRSYLAQHSAPELTESPIFIIGCQRSGTSLLRRILDSHPHIACPPESKFILPLEELVRHPQALEGLDSMGFTRAMVFHRLAAFVTGFFDDYAASKGKRRWADKTPNYVDCLPFLDELFASKACYIFIVRHPFDVCLSFEHAATKSGQPMVDIRPYVAEAGDLRAGACRFWNEQNLKIAEFIPQVSKRSISMDYETLTSHPEHVLREVFAFLDEPWSPNVLNYNQSPHDYGYEDRKIDKMPEIVPNSAKFLVWPERERVRLAAVAQEAMNILGYTPHQIQRGQAMGKLEETFIRIGHE